MHITSDGGGVYMIIIILILFLSCLVSTLKVFSILIIFSLAWLLFFTSMPPVVSLKNTRHSLQVCSLPCSIYSFIARQKHLPSVDNDSLQVGNEFNNR